MNLNADGTRASVNLSGEFSAGELEDVITQLALVRSRMSPPVPDQPPDPTSDPEKTILMESDCAMSAALRRNGGIRLWLRNRGFGWIGYEVEPARARAIAKYILSRTPEEGVDLFADSKGQRH